VVGGGGGGGAFLTMWTEGKVYVLHAGRSVHLDCEFYSETFNMFKNPVVWKKHQRHETTELNIMGNILPPFLDARRFRVAFDKSPPHYRMTLRVTGRQLRNVRPHHAKRSFYRSIFGIVGRTASE